MNKPEQGSGFAVTGGSDAPRDLPVPAREVWETPRVIVGTLDTAEAGVGVAVEGSANNAS